MWIVVRFKMHIITFGNSVCYPISVCYQICTQNNQAILYWALVSKVGIIRRPSIVDLINPSVDI